MRTEAFPAAFEKLTGNEPFPWQRALFERFVAGDVPPSCDIPTGLGKTSVIAVWQLARAAGAQLPRRLVYVVNRRTVVDQTTEEIHRLRAHCSDAGVTEDLEISTLRGQMADNRAWSADPSRPAVICGTVDMIGSRLLFSGYRIGFRARPLHAGFLGQDALLVHDEAHLEPAFQRLIEAIQAEQVRAHDPWPLRVMALSATSRDGAAAFHLGPEDERHPVVACRVRATKKLFLHACDEGALVESIVGQALSFRTSGRAVLVFLRTVDDVGAVVARLRKAGARVQQLTGTMRGYERDRLVSDNEVFGRFLGRPSLTEASESVYLVSTSAGEVGVNLSADDLICDLSTFDSMAQRFGRVNRFGLRTDSEVHVVHPDPATLDTDKPKDARSRLATLTLLGELAGDACPAALAALDPQARRAAFAPEPAMLEVTDILLDAWAATTIREPLPGRPPVEAYLHGVSEWEPPSTYVAWRMEVDALRDELARQFAQEIIDEYPLKPHELLTDKTSRVLDTLEEMAKKHPTPGAFCVWLVDDAGRVDPTLTLESLTDGDRRANEARLAGCTVLLPATQCRPVEGLFAAEGLVASDGAGVDMADEWFDDTGARLRQRTRGDQHPPLGMRLIRSITLAQEEEADEAQTDDGGTAPEQWAWYELPRAADNEGSRSASMPVLLDVHSADVEREATRIVERLPLEPGLRQAVIVAARLHDIGKNRRVWQRSIGNTDRSRVLAKSGATMRPLDVTAYRHELGSILDAESRGLLEGLSLEHRELALHLIAAHHGRARPHFAEDELFDPDARNVDISQVGCRVVMRFAELQKRYGRWGLAYLESLIRAADYAASAHPSKVEGQP